MRDSGQDKQEKEIKELFKQVSPNEIFFLKYIKNNNPYDFTHNIFDFSTSNTIVNYITHSKIYILAFANKNRAIIFFDLSQEKIISIIQKAHNALITDVRHIFSQLKRADLILSVSYSDNNLKVWETVNYSCILNLSNIYSNGYLYSATFIKANTSVYIATCNYYYNPALAEPIKIYNLDGKIMSKINNSNENTFYIDTLYIYQHIYIVTSNKGYAKAYSYYSNKLFHEYVDKEEKNNIFKMMINHYVKYKICIGLKTSSSANKIKFYNFFKGDLIKTIILDKDIFSDVIFWNYFFLVGLCVDKKIRFVDVEKEEIIDSLSNKKNKENFLIKKIMHPKYGECIISQEVNKEALKLWGQKL